MLLFLALLQTQAVGNTPTERISFIILTLVLLAGNVSQFLGVFTKHKKDITDTDQLTIASLKRAYEAQGLELNISVTNKEKLSKELESVSGEYQTLVGIDMQYILDLAREGMIAENAQMRRRLASYERRFGVITDTPESGEWKVK